MIVSNDTIRKPPYSNHLSTERVKKTLCIFAVHRPGGEPACQPSVGKPAGRIGRRMENLSSFKITVYAIKSENRNYIYVGMSNNLERRLKEHNQYQNKSTKAYAPFTLIYSETFDSRSEARIKEKYLKSGVGKSFLKSLT